MPRMARVVLPQYPHHVVQRGHNRQVVFAAGEDYQRYLDDLTFMDRGQVLQSNTSEPRRAQWRDRCGSSWRAVYIM